MIVTIDTGRYTDEGTFNCLHCGRRRRVKAAWLIRYDMGDSLVVLNAKNTEIVHSCRTVLMWRCHRCEEDYTFDSIAPPRYPSGLRRVGDWQPKCPLCCSICIQVEVG